MFPPVRGGSRKPDMSAQLIYWQILMADRMAAAVVLDESGDYRKMCLTAGFFLAVPGLSGNNGMSESRQQERKAAPFRVHVNKASVHVRCACEFDVLFRGQVRPGKSLGRCLPA